MDYSLAALKLLCVQLKSAHQTTSQNAFTLGGILFQRIWLQGTLISEPSSSDGNRYFVDDGTGVVELFLSGEFRSRPWETGMYVMVVGAYVAPADDLPMLKVHKLVDLSPFPDREPMWYLEVIEAFKLFYQPLFEE
ncbi:recq-mediated genome instability protein 2 [Phtheirospermum japonicum]|uniref:Recq-mediated genome instability protein 2 n=1 Tax=Phtheirospermum japonicum TaxID=374723 RepID=A0A830CB87_9LAMI|nr:recq-mediated genome instability protein 2 [Phtheirospermum japonicum]